MSVLSKPYDLKENKILSAKKTLYINTEAIEKSIAANGINKSKNNKFIKKYIVTLTALLSIFIFSGCSEKESDRIAAAFDSSPMKLEETISAPVIEMISEQDSTDDFEYNIQYPSISGLSNKSAEHKINSSIKAQVMDHVSTIKSYSLQSPQLRGSFAYQAYTQFEVKSSSPEFISMLGTFGEFTGGAHPNYAAIVYNFDLIAAKSIELDSLFIDDFDYKKIINSEISSQIKKAPADMMYFEQKELRFQSIGERQPYFIKDGKLNIQFGLYEIAPYVTGMPSFEIPSELIKEHIKPQYKNLFD